MAQRGTPASLLVGQGTSEALRRVAEFQESEGLWGTPHAEIFWGPGHTYGFVICSKWQAVSKGGWELVVVGGARWAHWHSSP